MVYMLLFRNDYPYNITLPFKNFTDISDCHCSLGILKYWWVYSIKILQLNDVGLFLKPVSLILHENKINM